jgi:hypothetical protein
MAQVHAFDFLVTGKLPNILVIAIRVKHVVVGDEFILLRGIRREIPLLLHFGVLLGREANPINIFLERKKKTPSHINNKQ